MSDHFFVAGKSGPESKNPLRYVSLGDLLARGGLKIDDFIEYGGVVSVIYQWGVEPPCDVRSQLLAGREGRRGDLAANTA